MIEDDNKVVSFDFSMDGNFRCFDVSDVNVVCIGAAMRPLHGSKSSEVATR